MSVLAIIGIVFGVGVVALLVYGITTHRTRPIYADAGTLPKLRFPPDWPPLTLIIDTELAELEDHIVGAVKEAAAWWEEETGRRYFVPPGDLGAGGHVIPVLEDLNDIDRAERAVAYVDPRTDAATGYLASTGLYLLASWRGLPHEKLVQVFKHEFGHCLGLAHDGDVRSIMYKSVGGRGQFVSPNDIRRLEELYPDFAA